MGITPKQIPETVDLERLTSEDFVFSGEFRRSERSYHGRRFTPEFRLRGTEDFVIFDELFPQDKFNQCYELIAQTPESTRVVGSGYLHQDDKGDICFGVRRDSQPPSYINSLPVWFYLLNEEREPIVTGDVDLIFVRVSPYHNEREEQRKRIFRAEGQVDVKKFILPGAEQFSAYLESIVKGTLTAEGPQALDPGCDVSLAKRWDVLLDKQKIGEYIVYSQPATRGKTKEEYTKVYSGLIPGYVNDAVVASNKFRPKEEPKPVDQVSLIWDNKNCKVRESGPPDSVDTPWQRQDGHSEIPFP